MTKFRVIDADSYPMLSLWQFRKIIFKSILPKISTLDFENVPICCAPGCRLPHGMGQIWGDWKARATCKRVWWGNLRENPTLANWGSYGVETTLPSDTKSTQPVSRWVQLVALVVTWRTCYCTCRATGSILVLKYTSIVKCKEWGKYPSGRQFLW